MFLFFLNFYLFFCFLDFYVFLFFLLTLISYSRNLTPVYHKPHPLF